MSLSETKEKLTKALLDQRTRTGSDPLLTAACGSLIQFADWMIETNARLGRIEQELGALAIDIDQRPQRKPRRNGASTATHGYQRS